jgi:alpha-L-arabinofuranosidase
MFKRSSGQKRHGKRRRLTSSRIEPLEQRFLLSAVSWVGPSGGSWTTAANWSSDVVPNSTSDVVINQLTNIQVNLTGSASVDSISVTGATLNVTSGTLSAVANSSVNAGGSLTLSAATLSIGGVARLTNSGSISVSAGSDLSVGGAYNQNAGGVLTLQSGALTSGVGTNLFSNPDFEAPAVTNSTTVPNVWGDWGPTYVSTQFAFNGKQSIQQSGANSGVNQSFSVTTGVSYTASVYAMTPSTDKLTGPQIGLLNILFFDSGGNQLAASTGMTVLNSNSPAGGSLTGSVGSQGWNRYTLTIVAPRGAVKATIALQVGPYSGLAGTAGGSVYWDEAQFGPTAHTSALFSAASISNSGTISIGAGDTANVTGVFAQTGTGNLNLVLGGSPAGLLYGSLVAGGAATLSGELSATLINGYAPALGDGFTLLTYGGETGGFTSVQIPSGSTYAFQPGVNPTYVGIGAVPPTTSTTVNIGTVIDPTPTNVVGVNIDWWDNQLTTTQTEQMVEAAGINIFRFPGGSSSDDYHFNQSSNDDDPSAITISQFAQFVQSVGGTGLVTTDYGSGSPQEAEAELAYLVGSPSDTTVIGNGTEWIPTFNSSGAIVSWSTQTFVGQTVGYWASLRAASPLGTNDGLNFLRINHAAPFSKITDWEIGNEQYGNWEIDNHSPTGIGGNSTAPYNYPAAYALFASQFANFVKSDQANLPSILIGIDSGDPTGASDNNWTHNVLQDGLADGFVPGFISDHSYMQGPGAESDSFLLNDTVSDAASTLDWSTRYSLYETMLQQIDGASASGTLVMATEFNSNYGTPGKQMTSIVNGLFIADSIGSLLDSGYSGGLVWDLRNGWDTSGNNSPTLYGWREGGDEGLIGSASATGAPSTGAYVAYPNYYAEELASKIVQSGSKVVSAVSNYGELAVYTVLEANGHLDLMVINKNLDASINEQFSLPGFNASGQAQVWQYGEVQDYAQSQSPTGASSLANLTTNLTFTGSNFSYSFPAYSMTVIDLTPTPVVVAAAAADSNPVSGISTDLSALGSENGISTGLTYTWNATGPASVLYTGNTNGTNAAANITAQFSIAGSYNFTVTIADANGVSTTSSLAVNVEQTPTSVTVTPSTTTVAPGGQAQFAAVVHDQFGNTETANPILWSVSDPGKNGNSINGTGLATFTQTPGVYTVTAGFGFASGNATVTVGVVPVVSSFQVNDGSAQRSMVDSLTLTFNEAVTLNAGAITLNLLSQTGGVSTPMSFTLTNQGGTGTTWVLTFTNPSYIGGSLPDGAYELSAVAGGVISTQGLNMSTTQNFTFWRLYGDFLGQGTVSGDDFTQLVTLIGHATNSTNWYVDYDDDGVIGGSDFTAFVSRLGHSISVPSLPSVVLLSATVPATTPLTNTQQQTKSPIVAANVTTPVTHTSKKKPPHGHR